MLGTEGVDRRISVELPAHKHIQGFALFDIQRNDFYGKPVSLRPILKKALLNAANIDTNALPIEGGKILSRDLAVLRVDIDVIGFRAHGQIREGHVFCALRLIGNIAQ